MYFHEVTLHASDLDAERAFYGEILELPVRAEANRITVEIGATRLSFIQAPERWNERYHFAFNIPENQIDEAAEWITSRIALLADAKGQTRFTSTGWNANNIYFLDAAGNILEFIARHTLKNATDTPFGSHSLLNISEIGIATDNVPGTVAALQHNLGATVYDGAGSDTFTAVGDEHGLLIVVKRGRIWYPDTGIAATVAPVEALVEQEGRQFRLTFPPLEVTLLEG